MITGVVGISLMTCAAMRGQRRHVVVLCASQVVMVVVIVIFV